MNALIIEDERLSAKRLQNIIRQEHPQINLLDTLFSVQDVHEWLHENPPPDLLFLDIQLNDGTGFDVLKLFESPPPVIFTTAYDQYAIKAFKFFSVDYLLKPIEAQELKNALIKFQKMKEVPWDEQLGEQLKDLTKAFDHGYKKRFLIRIGERFHHIAVEDIAYFYHKEAVTHLMSHSGKDYQMDQSLDQLEQLVNPLEFFRINRNYITSLQAVDQIHSYFNSRLLLKLAPSCEEEVIVSRDRVAGFKQWVDH